MESMDNTYHGLARKAGFKINQDTTNHMLMGRLTNTPEAVVYHLQGNRDMTIEKVTSIIYLGVLITDDSNNNKEIDARVVIGIFHLLPLSTK